MTEEKNQDVEIEDMYFAEGVVSMPVTADSSLVFPTNDLREKLYESGWAFLQPYPEVDILNFMTYFCRRFPEVGVELREVRLAVSDALHFLVYLDTCSVKLLDHPVQFDHVYEILAHVGKFPKVQHLVFYNKSVEEADMSR